MFHKDYERKIDQLVNELTLEEKIKMIHVRVCSAPGQ